MWFSTSSSFWALKYTWLVWRLHELAPVWCLETCQYMLSFYFPFTSMSSPTLNLTGFSPSYAHSNQLCMGLNLVQVHLGHAFLLHVIPSPQPWPYCWPGVTTHPAIHLCETLKCGRMTTSELICSQCMAELQMCLSSLSFLLCLEIE